MKHSIFKRGLLFLFSLVLVSVSFWTYSPKVQEVKAAAPTLVLTPENGVTLDLGQSVLMILLYDEDGSGPLSPKEANGLATWSSSNAGVAGVSSNGDVNAFSVGGAFISASVMGLTASTLAMVVSPDSRADFDGNWCTIDALVSNSVNRGSTAGFTTSYGVAYPFFGLGSSSVQIADQAATGGILTTKNPSYNPGDNLWNISVPSNASFGTHSFSTYATFNYEGGTFNGACNDLFVIVQAPVMTADSFSLLCSPASSSVLAPNISTPNTTIYNIEIAKSGTFTNPVTLSHAFSPSTGTLPTITYSSNPASPGSVVTATVSIPQNASPNTYTITFTGQGGGQTKTCQTSLTVNTVDLKCVTSGVASDGPCTVTSGSSPVLSWGATGADSCTLTPPGSSVSTTGQTSYTASAISSSTTYTLSCRIGTQAAVTDSVVVQVGTTPPGGGTTVNIKCMQSGSYIDGPCSVASGSGTLLDWNIAGLGSGTTCSITQNGAAFRTTTASETNITTGNLSINSTFTLTCGTATDSVTINVLNAPNPPASFTASSGCSVVDLAWSPSSSGTTPTGFRIYRATTQSPTSWGTPIADIPAVSGQTYYTYQDTSVTNGTTYYYSISSYNSGGESAKSSSYPSATPGSCAASLDNSDKDIVSMKRSGQTFTNTFTPCNNQSEVFALPNNGLFQSSDIVTFRIHACNSGAGNIAISVQDTLSNLALDSNSFVFSMITTVDRKTGDMFTEPCASATSITPNSFTLTGTAPRAVGGANGVCSITFNATVTSPTGAVSGSLYRFQNKAVITAGTLSKTVMTPPYLFQVGGGSPTRKEIAP